MIVWLALAAGLVFALAYGYELWYIFLSCVVFLCTWTMYGNIYPKEVVIDEKSIGLVMPFGNTVVMDYGDVNMTAVSYTHLDVYKRQTLWLGS